MHEFYDMTTYDNSLSMSESFSDAFSEWWGETVLHGQFVDLHIDHIDAILDFGLQEELFSKSLWLGNGGQESIRVEDAAGISNDLDALSGVNASMAYEPPASSQAMPLWETDGIGSDNVGGDFFDSIRDIWSSFTSMLNPQPDGLLRPADFESEGHFDPQNNCEVFGRVDKDIGIVNPLAILALIVTGGSIQAMLKGGAIKEKIKNKVVEETAKRMKDTAHDSGKELAKKIFHELQKIGNGIEKGLLQEIQGVLDIAVSARNSFQQGEEEKRKLDEAYKYLEKNTAALEGELKDLLFELAKA